MVSARREGYCEIRDTIVPPYLDPTPIDFSFAEDRECTPCPDPCTPEVGNYYALIIGNDDYQYIGRLETAVSDAKAVAAILEERYRFKIDLHLNASKADILNALRAYEKGRISGANLGDADSLLIYYAGHGHLVEEDEKGKLGYWLPVDADTSDKKNWIPNTDVVAILKNIPARHVIIISDSCYSGMLTRKVIVPGYRGLEAYEPGTRSYKDRFWRLLSKRSRTALTSGGLEPVVDAGGFGNHSVFTGSLLKRLNSTRNAIDGTSLFVSLRNDVIKEADQTPEYGAIHRAGHDGGDFIFVRHQ